MDFIEILKAVLLGIVEGITEWLPISSTGHMILVDEFLTLHVSKQFLELFLVVIQIGAILAVCIIYFSKLNPFSLKKDQVQRKATWKLWGYVAIGCIPAAIVGILLDDFFNEHFYNAWTVAVALIIYGIAFIVIEKHNEKVESFFIRNHKADTPLRLHKIETVEEMDIKTSLKIGLFQCLAIIPGTSRSGSTIIGGMLSGCSRTAATEYTFFLAIPVMLGWGLLKFIKTIIKGIAFTPTEIAILIAGVISAFVVSIFAIKFLLKFIKTHNFIPFGIYRIVVGIVVLAYFGCKVFL